jgi:hypothetical protein
VFYNITITSLSIIVAAFIGGLEVLQVMPGQLNLTGGLWAYANNFDLNKAGFVIAGPFVATWVIALSVWRFAHIEEKWPPGFGPLNPPGSPPRRRPRVTPPRLVAVAALVMYQGRAVGSGPVYPSWSATSRTRSRSCAESWSGRENAFETVIRLTPT